MKKELLTLQLLLFFLCSFSQKKLVMYTGVKFRITPIYTNGLEGLIISDKNIVLQQDKHLNGASLINTFTYNFKKFGIRYFLAFRYDLAESTYNQGQIGELNKRIFWDNGISVVKPFYPNTKRNFSVALGLGLNNYNSDYNYTITRYDSFGMPQSISGNDDFKFQTFNLDFSKDFNKVKTTLGVEYTYKHRFFQPSKIILLSLQATYRLSK